PLMLPFKWFPPQTAEVVRCALRIATTDPAWLNWFAYCRPSMARRRIAPQLSAWENPRLTLQHGAISLLLFSRPFLKRSPASGGFWGARGRSHAGHVSLHGPLDQSVRAPTVPGPGSARIRIAIVDASRRNP